MRTFPESAWTGLLAKYRDCVADRSEAPDEFHFASFVSTIGLTFGRRVSTHYGFPLFPNFYFLLLGGTGLKKTSAINIAVRFLRELRAGGDILRLQGLSTAEGLIAILAKMPGMRLLIQEAEFRALLKKAQNTQNGSLIPKLCDLYDAPDHVDLPTRKNPLRAERPLVALLSAATPASLEDAVTDNETYGGLFNRVIPVAGTPKPPQPWPQDLESKPWKALIREVDRMLAHHRSPVVLSISDPEARTLWETYYNNFHTRQNEAPELLAALCYRLHTHVQKFALFFAAIRCGNDISVEDLTRALEIVEYISGVIEDALRPLGMSPTARLESRIESLLMERPLTRRQLHQKLSGRVKGFELEQTLRTLINLERIVDSNKGPLAWAGAPYLSQRSQGAPSAGEDGASC